MLHSSTLQNIIVQASAFTVSSKQMHNYVNSLSKEEYASLSTVFQFGRSDWERNYYDTNDYYSFIESREAEGIKVTQEMLDSKFLSIDEKKKQIDLVYKDELDECQHFNGQYKHNWLSLKTNLIEATTKGIAMLKDIGI